MPEHSAGSDGELEQGTVVMVVDRRELELALHRIVDVAAEHGVALLGITASARRRAAKIRATLSGSSAQIAKVHVDLGGALHPDSPGRVGRTEALGNAVDLVLAELVLPGTRAAWRRALAGQEDRVAEARALVMRGKAFDESKSYDAALIIYRTVAERFGPPLRDSLRREISPFAELGAPVRPDIRASSRGDDKRAAGSVTDAALDQVVAWALLRMGLTLSMCERSVPAIAAYDEVIARYVASEHPSTRWRVGWAMYNKGLLLEQLERDEEAISAFEGLSSRYVHTSDPRVGIRVTWSLWKQAQLLRRAGRRTEAAALYEQVIERYDKAQEREVAESTAWSMQYLSEEFADTGRPAEAARIAQQLADRFATSRNTSARELAARASRSVRPT